jgi:hypothetical protein
LNFAAGAPVELPCLPSSADDTLARQQRAAWTKLFEEIDALPEVKHTDEPSGGRDHDRTLYGVNW